MLFNKIIESFLTSNKNDIITSSRPLLQFVKCIRTTRPLNKRMNSSYCTKFSSVRQPSVKTQGSLSGRVTAFKTFG